MKLPENTGMIEHGIELVEGKQPRYGPIYTLSPVELETLKTYIKTHLKIDLFDLLSLLLEPPTFFIGSLIATSACVLITVA